MEKSNPFSLFVMIFTRCVSFLLMMFLSWQASSQDKTFSFTGKVIDAQGAGIGGVSVSIRKGKIGTVTNESGEFELSKLPAGKQKVTFFYVGCKKRDTAILFEGPVNNVVVTLCANSKRDIQK